MFLAATACAVAFWRHFDHGAELSLLIGRIQVVLLLKLLGIGMLVALALCPALPSRRRICAQSLPPSLRRAASAARERGLPHVAQTDEWLEEMIEMHEVALKGNRAKISLKDIVIR